MKAARRQWDPQRDSSACYQGIPTPTTLHLKVGIVPGETAPGSRLLGHRRPCLGGLAQGFRLLAAFSGSNKEPGGVSGISRRALQSARRLRWGSRRNGGNTWRSGAERAVKEKNGRTGCQGAGACCISQIPPVNQQLRLAHGLHGATSRIRPVEENVTQIRRLAPHGLTSYGPTDPTLTNALLAAQAATDASVGSIKYLRCSPRASAPLRWITSHPRNAHAMPATRHTIAKPTSDFLAKLTSTRQENQKAGCCLEERTRPALLAMLPG